VHDMTGSYTVAFGTAIVGTFLSIATLWIAAPRKVRRVLRQR
jgi:hypothetical protein